MKNKTKFSCKKSETPTKLDLETHKKALTFLGGLMYILGDELTLDEALSIHSLIGTTLYNGDGTPYYIDDCYVLDTLRELSARGLSNFRKKGHTKCVRTTNSTKAKAVKRKSV